jgi:hypothetical protein
MKLKRMVRHRLQEKIVDFDEVITTENTLFEATGMVPEVNNIEVVETEVVKPKQKKLVWLGARIRVKVTLYL